jgi:hypothetical protein
MSEEIKKDDSNDEFNLTMDDMVNIVITSMQQNVVGIVIEEVLASLLKIPVNDVKSTFKSKILENMNQASKFLQPSLLIKLRRKDNGWYGKVIANNNAVLTDYTLIDVGGDESVHGKTPINSDGTVNISDRDPPYEGGKILWNFAIYREDMDYIIYATDFQFPLEDDNITVIVLVI